jgi:hypothetical protein
MQWITKMFVARGESRVVMRTIAGFLALALGSFSPMPAMAAPAEDELVRPLWGDEPSKKAADDEPSSGWDEPVTPTWGAEPPAETGPQEVPRASAGGVVSDDVWAPLMEQRVEVQMASGERLVGRLVEDHGSSIMMLDDTQTVRVFSKANVVGVAALDASTGAATAAATAAPPPDAPPTFDSMSRDEKIKWELENGEHRRSYRANNGLVWGGLGMLVASLLPLAIATVLITRDRTSDAIVAYGVTGVLLVGGATMGLIGAARVNKLRKKVGSKYPAAMLPRFMAAGPRPSFVPELAL